MIWKKIENTDWEISDSGELKTPQNRIYKGNLTGNGYLQVEIKGKKYLVHRLVGEYFIPYTGLNPDGTPIVGPAEINHKDENKENNSVVNLEWCDKTYNANHGSRGRRISTKLRNNENRSLLYKCIETGETGTSLYFNEKYKIKNKYAINHAANPNDNFHKSAAGFHWEYYEEVQ